MSAEAHRPVDGETGDSPEEAALARVLESYLAMLEAGRPADPDGLIAAHPELAGPLRACLKVMHLAAGLGGSSGPPANASGADPDGGITALPAASALTVLWPHDDPSSHLLLPEAPEDEAPIVQVGGEALPPSTDGIAAGRYQVLGEIARGGMGVVLRARDADLGRDLALKVLQSRHRGDPDVVGRFIEEARIGGQLQHPGIVPVHELGTLADRRPYFTMKLVKGRTLAALLGERPGPDADLPRLLTVFEQVCQTVAYAHARRVIHRDLKPANVMVGHFGEVQVVDWGLAKVLAEGGVADEARAMAREESTIWTARSGPAGVDAESRPGSVLGTPSYMAPEQARGEIDRVDERSDVFGLGAILCEVLTGRPPFAGSSRNEIRARAARGDLSDAMARLEACGADAELIALARDCLAAEPDRRPRNAGEVARRMSAYQGGVRERLRSAELARARAMARAEGERKRRRVMVALAASIAGLALLGGGGGTYLIRQRLEREARVERASGQVESLYAEARDAVDDLPRWAAAREAARSLEAMLADAPDRPTRDRLAALVLAVDRAAASAEGDRRLLARLAGVRGAGCDDTGGATIDASYAAAFRDAGLSLEAEPTAAAAAIRARPAPVRVAIAASVDDWSAARRVFLDDRAGANRLNEVARLADPDPWRDRLRAAIALPREERRAGLSAIAASTRVDELPPASLRLLGASLRASDEAARAEALLREALLQHPGDPWVNLELARCLERLSRRDEAIRYFMAARALRAESSHDLAHALERKGEISQAIAVFRDLVRRRPEDGNTLACLGDVLQDHGRARDAEAAFDAAVAVAREERRRRPDDPSAHFELGHALQHRGDADGAIAEYREALRLRPNHTPARLNLGNVLSQARRDHDGAIAEFRALIRLRPTEAGAHRGLGVALYARGKVDEAIAEYREALRLDPDRATFHVDLGNLLAGQGRLEEAVAEYREALRIDPDLVAARGQLSNALHDQGKFDEAIAELRRILAVNPEEEKAHSNLGRALREQGRTDEALSAFRTALRLNPDLIQAHANVGVAMRSLGRYPEALAAFRQARDLARRANPGFVEPIERYLAETERERSMADRLPAMLSGRLRPTDESEYLDAARIAHDRGPYGASARLWAEAFQAHPRLIGDMRAQHRYNAACAAALAGCGRGRDDPPLDEAARARWRKQAIDWLKADLAAWAKILESGPPQARPAVAQTLRNWRADPDLAGLRQPGSVGKLPQDEQDACRALWKGVDDLLAKAAGPRP